MAERVYKDKLWTKWGLRPKNELLRLVLPEQKNHYPLIMVQENGEELPFAATDGPLFKAEMQKRLNA